jgi:hypothetical protein
MKEDLPVFCRDFGVTATFSTLGGVASTATVTGIFDNAYAVATVEDGLEVESRHPALTCPVADVAGVVQGDSLSIAGTTYSVVDPMPDGTGMVTLLLSTD